MMGLTDQMNLVQELRRSGEDRMLESFFDVLDRVCENYTKGAGVFPNPGEPFTISFMVPQPLSYYAGMQINTTSNLCTLSLPLGLEPHEARYLAMLQLDEFYHPDDEE